MLVVGKVRLVGVDTPEADTYKGSIIKIKVFNLLYNKKVHLDIDNKKHRDKYGRVLAVVYTSKGTNLNKWLLNKKYAKVMYISPSEFVKGCPGKIKKTVKKIKKFKVVASRYSDIYHRTYCKWAKKIRNYNKITFSVDKAESNGYRACYVCF